MNHSVDIQIACECPLPVSESQMSEWVTLALSEQSKPAELTLRLVSAEEITDLNKTYRKQDKPTNVLAFPGNVPEHIELDYCFLGDVIVCPAVLASESVEHQKTQEAHWAHIIIHGVLHLLGHDHLEEQDTARMQELEIRLLSKLGFANPYDLEDKNVE